jgi:DNA primase
MRFSEGLREEILRRTDLVRLVGKRVKLDRKGRVHWGLCPFHKEKSSSFKVDNERRNYHCFGCGAGGDAFKWLMEMEGLTFPESVQRLAEEAGVELPAWSPEDEARESKRKSLYEIVSLACEFYEAQLVSRQGEAARRYLQGRGLDPAAQKRHRLGFSPSHSALKEHLAAKGIVLEDMIEAGLVRPAEDGKPARDFFYDRVMFPIADVRGRIVAFGGRGMAPDAKPKYINTGETPLFSKGRLLYHFGPAREAAARGAPLIVAEGYMDVIALAEAGFMGAVAPLGTALTEDQLQMLWRVVPEPIMCFDGDEAGRRAATRASRLALPFLIPGQSLRFVFLPKGEDPDSLIRSQGAEVMRAALEKAEPLADVLWKTEFEGKNFSTPERRAGLEAELDGLIKQIKDAKIADYYRRDFNDRVFKAFKQRKFEPNKAFKPGRNSVRDKGKGFRGGKFVAGRFEPPRDESVSDAVKRTLHAGNALSAAKTANEWRLVGLLIHDPYLVELHAEGLAWQRVDEPQLDRVLKELLNLANSGKRLDKTSVEAHLVRQGFGAFLERLTTLSVLQSDLKECTDTVAREALLRRTREQLADPDNTGVGEVKAKRDEALGRYLDSGANEDWEELQRLNGQLRSAKQA